MKHIILAIVIMLALMQVAQSQPKPQDSDTVWTKNIWPDEVATVLFSPDGSKIFVSTNLKVWVLDTQTGDSIGILPGVGTLKCYSPDNNFIYTKGLQKLSAQSNAIVSRFDTIPAKGFQLSDVALTGDGKFVIATSSATYKDSVPPYNSYYNNIAIFNSTDMKFYKLISYPEQLTSITTSPDGKYFVTYSIITDAFTYKILHETLTLWDAQKFQQIKIIYQDTLAPIAMKFTPDSKYLAVIQGGYSVLFYDTQNFIQVKSIVAKTATTLTNMCFTNDMKYMITGGGIYSYPTTWDFDIGKIIYEYNILLDGIHLAGSSGININSNNNFILTADGYLLALLNSKFKPNDIIVGQIDKNNFIIYPNPLNGLAIITFKPEKPGNYCIKIIDGIGKSINEIYNGYLLNNKQEFTWNSFQQPNGIYYCKIIGNGVNSTYKIIVSK